jgi:SpoVK/Ycf46/Vps4 family AAA+-type ATPase
MVDLSRSLQQQLKLAQERALTLRNEQRFEEAAIEFERCALLMKDLIKEAVSDETKEKRLHKAKQYLQLAVDTRALASSGPKDEPVREESPQSQETQNETSARILSLLKRSDVTWRDIEGLDSAIEDIRAAYTFARATLPEGVKVKVSNSLLLYGPPGTGKTLLASAASNELEASFFNIKVDSLLSKYFGESSRLIAELFEEARKRSPSLLFFDEIDVLTQNRDAESNSAEKRVLASLLTEWDGLVGKSAKGFLYIIGATNRPWDIDDAIRSRFGKIVYIPLPNAGTRELILRANLEKNGHECRMSYDEIAARTEDYSGRDLEKLCSEATERMLKRANLDLISGNAVGKGAAPLRICPISEEEMSAALDVIRPKVDRAHIARYEHWAQGKR